MSRSKHGVTTKCFLFERRDDFIFRRDLWNFQAKPKGSYIYFTLQFGCPKRVYITDDTDYPSFP